VQQKKKNGTGPASNGHGAPANPPLLQTAGSTSHSTPSSQISTPVQAQAGGSTTTHSAASPAAPAAGQASSSSPIVTPAAVSSSLPTPNSQPGSQHGTPGKKKKPKGGQGGQNQQNQNHQLQQQNQQQQQQQQQQLMFPQGFVYPGQPGPMLFGAGGQPFPVPLGPNGLPNYAGMMGPAGFLGQQFPMYAMQPQGMPFMPQQQHGGGQQQGQGKQQRQNQPQGVQFAAQPQGTFQPGVFAGGSGSSTPAAGTPTGAGSAPGSAQSFRGGQQPYSAYFLQQQAAAYQMAQAYPMASMAAMNLGGGVGGVAPYPVMPVGAAPMLAGGFSVGAAIPSASVSSSSSGSSNNPAIQGQLPSFPSPFATPPFAALMSTASFPLNLSAAPYFSVDVECVATGTGHNDRALAHVAVVDQHSQIVLNLYIKPTKPVVSYLPALTGLSEQDLVNGVTEEEALAVFRATIPNQAVLVGQNILKDVEWLHLVEGEDFSSMLDLAGLFACKNPQYSGLTFFSLAHEAKALLALDQSEMHHPAVDAWLSIKLYELYQLLQTNPSELERSKQLLLELPVEPAFSKKNPIYTGVCMGNRKLCKCGSPWFF
jgi:DNA polymerase III epsilon subunit-like protein